MIDLDLGEGELRFRVLAVPRASRSEVTGEMEGALRVRIAAPPVDGAANKELIKVLSKFLGVSKSDVEISAGEGSRRKTVTVRGAKAKDAARRLKELC